MSAPDAENDRVSGLPLETNKPKGAAARASDWLSQQLERSDSLELSRIRVFIICTFIFLSAAGVRLLHWQDEHVQIVGGETSLSGVFSRYDKEARRMIDEGWVLFPREAPANGDARMLTHPPGYSIILAAIYRFTDDPYPSLWLIQILADGLAAVLVFLIAAELLNWIAAAVAAMLVAISPHLAHYSLLPLPDSLVVLPILVAVYLIVAARKRPSLWLIITAGACTGLSCWLRANALLLAPFLSLAVLLVFERPRRVLYACALTATMIVVISPITIRNLVVFHRLIPLSIQAGLNLVEGIGDFDRDGKLGMPRSDREAKFKDAEWHGRPDYAATLWVPDGIARDRARFDRGLSVIRSRPGWFAGVMLRRAAFMLSYNDGRSREWPFSTATVSPLLKEAGYGHTVETSDPEQLSAMGRPAVLVLNGAVISRSNALTDDRAPVNSISPTELNSDGVLLSPQATASLREDGQTFELAGDSSAYGDQFASGPIAVKRNTDYVLVIPVNILQGDMALKVASADRRIALAISALAGMAKATETPASDDAAADLAVEPAMTVIQMPFASSDKTEVRLVLSNNGAKSPAQVVQLGQAQIFEMGATPGVWTHYPRLIIRSLQRKFTTAPMLVLVFIGIALLLLARRGRTLVVILAVPAYYMLIQSPLHTEYRYILAIHYFIFMMAATAIYFGGVAVFQTGKRVHDLSRHR